jgi:hypothetical protein
MRIVCSVCKSQLDSLDGYELNTSRRLDFFPKHFHGLTSVQCEKSYKKVEPAEFAAKPQGDVTEF